MEEHAKHSMLYYSNDPQALINIKRYHTIINQVVQIISVSDQQMNPNMNLAFTSATVMTRYYAIREHIETC